MRSGGIGSRSIRSGGMGNGGMGVHGPFLYLMFVGVRMRLLFEVL